MSKKEYAKWLVNSLSWKGPWTIQSIVKKYTLKELKYLYKKYSEKEKDLYYETLC